MLARATQDPNTGSLSSKYTSMAMRFVARRVRSKLLAMRNTSPMVTFSFDDVPASACEVGAPILERHGARGTFFISGGGCGTSRPGEPLCASIAQLKTIWSKGHEIGCHTFSHAAVRRVSSAELDNELDRNQAVLRHVGRDIVVRNFAYPFGDFSVASKRYLETRFDSCRSGHAGVNSHSADLGALEACPLQDAAIDRTKISELVAETVKKCGWLIFYSHDVADAPSQYGVTSDLLEWAISAAKRSGCTVTTVAGALSLARGEPARADFAE